MSLDYQATLRHLHRAVQLDPTFVAPRLRQWRAYENLGRRVEADATLRALEAPALFSLASPAEQSIIRHQRATTDGKFTEAAAAAREYARFVPEGRHSFHTLGWCLLDAAASTRSELLRI